MIQFDYSIPIELQLSVFKEIFGKLSGKHRNPLRKDRRPGCPIYVTSTNVYLMDFKLKKRIGAVELVSKLKNIHPKEAVTYILQQKKINYQFKKERKLKGYIERTFDKRDELYWKDIVPVESLRKYGIVPVRDTIYSDCVRACKGISYAIHYNEGFKIYSPFSETKFLCNTPKHALYVIEGDKKLPLVVTSSAKDAIVLRSYGVKNRIIVPTSETCIPEVEGFEELVIVYDNDPTGREYARQIAQYYRVPSILFFFSQKDPYDALRRNPQQFGYEMQSLCEYSLRGVSAYRCIKPEHYTKTVV